MSPPDLKRLRELATKATPGPWKSRASVHGTKYRYVQFNKGEPLYTTLELEPGDANLIAACSPDVILALIDMAEGKK